MPRAKDNTTPTVRLSVSGKAVEIMFDILSMCSDGGANKTAIMYRSNLSHDQFVRYLAYLADRELLTGRMEIPRSSLVRRAVRYLLDNPTTVMPSWESDG